MVPETSIPASPSPLYLRIAESSLCFARYESLREPLFDFSPFRVRPGSSLTVNLREACGTESILRAPAGRVQALVSGPVTPVPLADFQEENCRDIYDYCFPAEEKRRIFYDALAPANAVLLFSLEETACRTLEETFGDVHYISCLTPVLRHFAAKGNVAGGKRLFAYAHEENLSLSVFEESRLLMANTFRVKGPADAAYYVFNAASKLAIDRACAPFYVAGAAEERESIAAELRKYAANVCPINPSGEFNRHKVAVTPGVPYDLMTFLLDY